MYTKITPENAKELAIKKWELIVSQDGVDVNRNDLINAGLDILVGKTGNCSYCHLYNDPYGDLDNVNCKGCPISPEDEDWKYRESCGCYQPSHPYIIWLDDSTKENAQKVLDLIKSK